MDIRHLFGVKMKLFVSKFGTTSDEINGRTIHSSTVLCLSTSSKSEIPLEHLLIFLLLIHSFRVSLSVIFLSDFRFNNPI